MKEHSRLTRFVEKLFDMKYLGLFVSILFLIGGVFAIFLGVRRIYFAFNQLFLENGNPGHYIIKAVDTLLFALVILILSGGIYKLFVGDTETFRNNVVLSKLNNFKDLKVLLWETLLLTLTVWAALSYFHDEELQWVQLILPLSILILALALRVLKGGNPFKNEK
jgi:uncharacterized membrane protein YqhA